MIALGARERDGGRPVIVYDPRESLNSSAAAHALLWWFLAACKAARRDLEAAPSVACYVVKVRP